MSTEKETRGSITLDLGGALSIETDEVADLNGKITELSDELSIVKDFIGMSPDVGIIPELVFLENGSCYPSHLEFPEDQRKVDAGIYEAQPYLKSVKFSDTMTAIADNAFQNCTGLNTVEFGKNITSIGENAFNGCKTITSLDLPVGLKTIGANAFQGCAAITGNITFPMDFYSLGKQAFHKCSSLKSVTFSTKLKSIPEFCFARTGLETVLVPGNITNIGSYSFAYNPNLTTAHLDHGVQSLGDYIFAECPILKEAYLPNTIGWIASAPFLDCPLLETLVLEQGFNCELILTANSQLSTESLVGIIDALADLNGQTSKRLVLGNINLNKLTAEQKAIATNKNWAIN